MNKHIVKHIVVNAVNQYRLKCLKWHIAKQTYRETFLVLISAAPVHKHFMKPECIFRGASRWRALDARKLRTAGLASAVNCADVCCADGLVWFGLVWFGLVWFGGIFF
jgi:hypothetical protein